jgi:hypothetical protein
MIDSKIVKPRKAIKENRQDLQRNRIGLNMFASPKAFAYPREAKHPREMPLRPAALLPYSDESELRPVALRPTLSDGLPFSNERNLKKNHSYYYCKTYAIGVH